MATPVMNFATWKSLKEANESIEEANALSEEVFSTLESFFMENGIEATFEDAKEFVSTKVEGWELSTEDFESAKSKIEEGKKSEEESDDEDSKMDDVEDDEKDEEGKDEEDDEKEEGKDKDKE